MKNNVDNGVNTSICSQENDIDFYMAQGTAGLPAFNFQGSGRLSPSVMKCRTCGNNFNTNDVGTSFKYSLCEKHFAEMENIEKSGK